MNQVFSLTRFTRLWRSYWIERWRELAGVLVIGGLLNLAICVLLMATEESHFYSDFQYSAQIGWFTIGLFLSGSVFSGLYFRPMNNPGAGLLALQRPSSHLEKTLLALLITCCIFPLVFTLLFSLINYPFIKLAQHWYVQCANCANEFDYFRLFIPLTPSDLEAKPYYMIQWLTICYYLCIQAIIVGGYLFFKRHTIFALAILSAMVFFLVQVPGLAPRNIGIWGEQGNLAGGFTLGELIISLLEWILLPIGLWVVVFLNLKER